MRLRRAPVSWLVLPLLVGGAVARAQPQAPPPPDAAAGPSDAITGEAPIVAGNAASAKQRALDDALRQAVERTFNALVAEGAPPSAAPAPALAQLHASLFGRAKRYVRSYRVLDQGEEAGRYRVQVQAEVDEGVLRRDIERARGASAAAPVPSGAGVLVVGAPAEAVAAVARAVSAAGVKAETPPLGAVDDGRARELAGRTGAAAAALVSSTVTPEGTVRGTGKLAASCRMAVRVVPASGDHPADRGTETRAFSDSEAAARSDCLARAAAEVAPQIIATLSTGPASAPGTRLLTLDVDLVEPAALPLVLQALRKAGSGAEVRRVTVGHVELRVSTRLPPPALLAALARELGSAASVTPGEAVADRVALQVRLASPEPAPAPP